MKELDIFLRALEQRLNIEQNSFIYRKCSISNSKFPAYKDLTLEVWLIDKDREAFISKVNASRKETNDEEREDNKKYLLIETYKKLLEFYGI